MQPGLARASRVLFNQRYLQRYLAEQRKRGADRIGAPRLQLIPIPNLTHFGRFGRDKLFPGVLSRDLEVTCHDLRRERLNLIQHILRDMGCSR